MPKTNKDNIKELFSSETILQGMPQLAYIFDKEGRMLMWNKNVEIVLGYSKDELYYKFVSEFIDEPDREKTLEAISRIFTENKEQTIDYKLLTKLGGKIPYIGSGSPFVLDGKEYFIGQAINISKVKNPPSKKVALICP